MPVKDSVQRALTAVFGEKGPAPVAEGEFEMTGAQVHDRTQASALIEQLPDTGKPLLATRAAIVKPSVNAFNGKARRRSSREGATAQKATRTWIGGFIAAGIWSKTPLHA